MKKLFAILTAMILMLPALGAADCGCGCGACECGNNGVLIARSETATAGMYTGSAWWALTNEHRVFGKISPDENVGTLPANPPKAGRIGGCMDNGVIRDKHTMTVISAGGAVYGLTQVDVRIEIRREAVELVESIVRDRMAVDEVTANAVIAATMWWRSDTVCHMFFLPDAPKMIVGCITANGGAVLIDLYAGDWDGDGALELGFCVGSSPAPTPTPVPESTPAPKTETRTECTVKKTCVKNVYVTNVVQINIGSNKAVQNVNVGKPCVKPCLPECLK